LDPWPLYEALRPKKWQIKAKTYMAPYLGSKINWFKQKKKRALKFEKKRRARNLKNQEVN
jgi:hypothetical protein